MAELVLDFITNPFVSPSTRGSSSNAAPDVNISAHLECPICLTIPFVEPISLHCGHTFDRHCLRNTLRSSKNSKKCPSCRALCHISAESASENVTLREICILLHPTLYQKRVREVEAEKQDWALTLPIFFHNDVTFPGSTVSLHLFEPRYKLLAQRAAETTRTFAYCPNFARPYSVKAGDIVLVAALEEAHFLPDGRCLLEAKLTARHVVVDHFVEDETGGLHFSRVNPQALQDDPIVDDAAAEAASAIVLDALQRWARQSEVKREPYERRYGAPPTVTANCSLEAASLWIAGVASAHGALDHPKAMSMLATRNTLERLQAASLCFRAVMHRVESGDLVPARGLLSWHSDNFVLWVGILLTLLYLVARVVLESAYGLLAPSEAMRKWLSLQNFAWVIVGLLIAALFKRKGGWDV